MKETRLQRWCDQAWLYVVYLLGIIIGNVLLIKWSAWDIPTDIFVSACGNDSSPRF